MQNTELFEEVEKAIESNDFGRAQHLLIPLAESGDPEAQYRLGTLRLRGASISEEVAYDWIEKAAKQNHPDALYYWASHCRPRESALIIKAAELGSTKAQHLLGVYYATGDSGYPKNEQEAVKWYKLAAEAGDSDAQHNLGTMLLYGEGTAKDPIGARRWLERSARQGNQQAKRLLLGLYGCDEAG
jgi:TPR repeat protein